jgi:hypothetical protein
VPTESLVLVDSCAIHLEAVCCHLLNSSRGKVRDKAGEQPIVSHLYIAVVGMGALHLAIAESRL